ncbi:MAG: pilin [Elusimicrobia bacterium]|nr:pilin [Elusimicrobiota bacterium]
MKRKTKGFTLVELVITITIVVILSSISVPIYKSYTKEATMAEGYSLLATIREAQLSYRAEYGNFLRGEHSSQKDWHTYTCNEEVLGINGRLNKYFTWFKVGGYSDKYSFRAGAYIPDKLRKGYDNYLMLSYCLTGEIRYYKDASGQ